jgi:hypothetical protein
MELFQVKKLHYEIPWRDSCWAQAIRGFLYGQWIGIAMFLLYALTSKGRNDLKEDFWTIMNCKYRINKR